VTELLRLAKLGAVKLDLKEFQQWISSELNGYTDDVPPYRIVRGQMKAVNPYHGLVPVVFPADSISELVTRRNVSQRIAEVESLASQDHEHLMMPISDEQQILLQRMFRQNLEFKLVFHPIMLLGIVDAVRNAILDWSLALEKDGIKGEGMSFSKDDKDKAHKQTVSYRIDRIENFTGALGNISGGQINATTTVINAAEIKKVLAEIDKNIDSFSFKKEEKARVLEIIAEVRGCLKDGSLASRGSALLSSLKGIFEKAAGSLLSSGIVYELGKILH
jgi:hypothetical protein